MSKRLSKRVLLLGWDAADWHIINPLIEAGQMPVLARLIEIGVSGKMSSLQPVTSPILWNSVATGKYADKHGVLGFVEPMENGEGVRAISSTSRRAKALWNILSQNRMRSSVVNWYASHPAEPINGIVFTNRFVGLVSEEPGAVPAHPQSYHPPDLAAVVDDLRVHPTELSLEQVLAFFPGKRPTDLDDPRLDTLVKILAQCANTQNAATWLAQRDDWDLLAVYYEALDHVGHQFVEYHPPAMAHVSAEDAEIYGGVVNGFYRFHDMLLGRLLDMVGQETAVILISDHGFYSDHLRPPVREHVREEMAKVSADRNPTAWHRPHGVFVAAGGAIKQDELIHGVTLLDVAPTVLALLGLPVPDDMDGKVLTRLFREPVEIERIPSYEEPHPQDGVPRGLSAEEADPWAARQALQQLADLGYISLPDDGNVAKLIRDAEWDRRSNLAQVYYSTGRSERSLEVLRELLQIEDRQHLRCRIALCLLSLGRLQEAEEALEGVDPAEARTPLPRLLRGQIRLAQNRSEEAIALLEPLLKEEFPLSHLHTVLGQAYLRRGLLAEAEAAFRKALDREEENAEAHDGLGVVFRRRGQYEDAVYEHTRAAALLHHRAQTHINLGLSLTMSHQYDWAVRAFSIAIELAPRNPFPHRCLSHLYGRLLNDPEKARAYLATAVELRRQLIAEAKAVAKCQAAS